MVNIIIIIIRISNKEMNKKREKKMHRTSTRPVMRNIKSANSPSSPRKQQQQNAYDVNLDVSGDADFDKHLRKKQKNKPKLMQNVQSVGSIHEHNAYKHRNVPSPP